MDGGGVVAVCAEDVKALFSDLFAWGDYGEHCFKSGEIDILGHLAAL